MTGRSLFEEMMASAVVPFEVELPDGDETAVWSLAAVDPDGVCDLDDADGPVDELEGLLGDLADEILDCLDALPRSATTSLLARIRAHFSLPDLPSGAWTVIVEQLDRYGAALEADFHDRGHDLLDWFRGARPWGQLLRLIGQMPEGCRYRAAILDDEDLARERLDSGLDSPSGSGRPPLVGETLDRQYLRAILSATKQTTWAALAAQAGKKAGKPPEAMKGPETAEDRLKTEYAKQMVEDVFDQVTPNWRAQAPVDQ